MLLQRVEVLLLLLPGDVAPELHQDDVLLREHALELDDPVERDVEVLVLDAAEDAVDDVPRVPAAEEDPHPAGGRQAAPVAPVLGPIQLFFAGLAHHVRLHSARVEPFEEEVDHLALARAFHARDQDHARLLRPGQVALRLQ